MKNKVYGVIGIKSVMSNWNADFTGRPKTISDNTIFGSDKALKYSMKRHSNDKGEKILYLKSFKTSDKDKIQPRSLKERYEQLFHNINEKTPSKEVLHNLFSALDVMWFGATFAEGKNNISITGAIQIGQGFNYYEDSNVEVQDILSPFRNKEDADASTLGKKIVSDEAHYFYPFSVNPMAYNNYEDILENFDGFTQEAYDKFKEVSLCSATLLATNSKVGCENEFAVFVEGNETLYLPNLATFMAFEKGEDKDTIIFKGEDLLNQLSNQITSIEVYYNPYSTKLDGFDMNKVTLYNIFTREVI
ncbi:CRISPR-associated protein Csh2 [Natranaerovirga hydrolytica]|uniref:CRISPR-associated protein Csh2 n=1 Tax=Natranaerovirga hydrolytica TaxID=680378 RepID=A0A4R1MZG2_9FIRM|nr:type I CRISPR-associated protein Cas7 [Natranaerovirga hydrolytica]TCK98666.1 CRISPR-associated protein Csh2 [Natranaerovirga hydrolytica]